ncbi:MAG: hypothetical protein U9P81_02120 [Euryarchaeota archaeon]|nr:hypothetical protein [Euryarchaeota archaeon]
MKNKKFDALEMKHQLQKEAELKLANLSEKEQIEHILPPCLYPHTLTTRPQSYGCLRICSDCGMVGA